MPEESSSDEQVVQVKKFQRKKPKLEIVDEDDFKEFPSENEDILVQKI